MQKLLIRIVNCRLQKLCICLTSQKDWVKHVILSVNYQNIFIVHDFNDNKSYWEFTCPNFSLKIFSMVIYIHCSLTDLITEQNRCSLAKGRNTDVSLELPVLETLICYFNSEYTYTGTFTKYFWIFSTS